LTKNYSEYLGFDFGNKALPIQGIPEDSETDNNEDVKFNEYGEFSKRYLSPVSIIFTGFAEYICDLVI